jgi:hypothetical protein
MSKEEIEALKELGLTSEEISTVLTGGVEGLPWYQSRKNANNLK